MTSSLLTARLHMRLPTACDVETVADIHRDPDVSRYVLGLAPDCVTIDSAWRNIALMLGHWQLCGIGAWLVEERASGAVIGRVGFWNPPGWPGVELTWLIRRSHWDQGFATEAAGAAIKWAQLHTKLDRLISLIQPENARSIRVADKLGMRMIGSRDVVGVSHQEYAMNVERQLITPSARGQAAWRRRRQS
jgi:RimJ/RimL family protein N-acetyltransferase